MIQDTAWSPRFVASTTATAATSSDVNTGTDTNKFITPAALAGSSPTFGGNATASDLILGTSGPSAKSSIAARAARQGLVFDGTAGATVSVAGPGTGDFTQVAWVRTTGGAQPITSGAPSAIASLWISSTGKAQFRNDGVAILLTGNATVNDGKSHLIVATKTGGTLTLYVDGISDASVADSTNFSTAITRIGLDYSGGIRFTGSLVGLLLYNRALSAAEVVSLYEAGVPSGADYNNASSTSTVTGDSSTFTSGVGSWSGWGAGTITASGGVGNVTSGATTDNGDYLAAQLAQTPVAFTNLNKRYRITLTLGSVTGGTVTVRNLVGSGTKYATGLTSGTHIIETGLIVGQQNFGLAASASGVTFTVDNITVVPIGLLLAPDAAQAGGGLVWYDTSGNAANITLPASGVSWNVPFAGYVTAPTTTNLTLAGGSSGASLVLGQGTSGAATLTVPVNSGNLNILQSATGTMQANIKGHASGTNPDASTSRGSTLTLTNLNTTDGNGSVVVFQNSGELSSSYILGLNNSHASRTGALLFGTANGAAPTERARITAAGNLGIGTTAPSYILDVQNAAPSFRVKNTTAAGGATRDSTILLEAQNDFSGQTQAYIKGILAGSSGLSTLTFGTAGAAGDTTATERMRITSGGNLLIGTPTDGGQKLQVNGTVTATNSLIVTGTSPVVLRSTGTTDVSVSAVSTAADSSAFVYVQNDARQWTMRVNGADSDKFNIRDSTAGADRLTIDSAGAATFAGDLTVSGDNVGVGTTVSAATALTIRTSTLTGTDQIGLYPVPIFSSASTTSAIAINALVQTEAASFTVANAYALAVSTPSLGAGSAITTQRGINVANQGAAGITNAYGIDIAAQSGAATTNVAIRAAGKIMFTSLPTSSVGLATGELWNDSGTVKIA